MAYLGYMITRKGIKPHQDKIQAILQLGPPKTVHDVRSLLGIIQYYRDMWPRRSHTLAPLTDLISSKNITDSKSKTDKLHKIDWTQECQEAFDTMKLLIARDVLLAYPRFDQPF